MSENNESAGVVIEESDNDDVLNASRTGSNISFKKILIFLAIALMLVTGSIFGGFTYMKNQLGWARQETENYRTKRSYQQAPDTIGQYNEPLIQEIEPIEEDITEEEVVVEEEINEQEQVMLENAPLIIEQPQEESDEPSLTDRRLASTINDYNNMANSDDEVIPNLQVKLLDTIDYTLVKGTKIPCVMETNIVSEQDGYTSCVVSQDIYSANARILLVEKGTKVTGEYRSDVKNGDRRLQVIWDRLITPYDIVVQLNSPSTDRLGAAGVTGEVDNRWGLRIGSALLVSMISDVIDIAGDKTEKGNNSQIFVESETSETSQRMAEKVLEKNIDLNPIIYIREGEMINIYVADDIDLSDVYNAKTYANYNRKGRPERSINPAQYYK